jgi:hypothetical protein
MAAAVLTGQLFVGWTNDLVDAPKDQEQNRRDKPLATGQISRQTVRNAATAALVTIPLSLATGLGSGAAHLTAVAAATAYNLGLKRTAFSVLPYALAFGLVPTFVTAGPPITHLPPLWATAAAAFLGAGAHFTQTLTGLEGLPARLGRRATSIAGPALMAGAALTVALGASHKSALLYVGLASATGLLAATTLAAVADKPKLAFRLTLATAAAVTATVLAAGVSF